MKATFSSLESQVQAKVSKTPKAVSFGQFLLVL
jgi:hypothetical protein